MKTLRLLLIAAMMVSPVLAEGDTAPKVEKPSMVTSVKDSIVTLWNKSKSFGKASFDVVGGQPVWKNVFEQETLDKNVFFGVTRGGLLKTATFAAVVVGVYKLYKKFLAPQEEEINLIFEEVNEDNSLKS